MSAPDLSQPIYAALAGDTTISAALPSYAGAPAVFTSRPTPKDAPFPMILAAGDIAVTDQDFIDNPLPVLVRDISVFGQNDAPAHVRAVETIALRVRDLFHRQRASLSVPGWNIIDIVCKGPVVGATDDETTAHRLVTLTIRLTQ